MKLLRPLVFALLAVLAASPIAQAQERPERADRSAQARPADDAQHGPGVLRLLPPDATSDKEIAIDGRTVAYTATAGTLALFDQSGEKSAQVFYTAYIAKNANENADKNADATRRPLTFAFNGGPGAASAYINLGFAGPRIADFGKDGRDGAAAKLVDNPESWLDFTDLVMIDPIGTGWSRTAKADDAKHFWSIGSDASLFAKVIALYVAKNSRGASPKYLLGESYGGFRAAKVARALQNDQGIVVAGITMVSPLLEASFQWGPQNALGSALRFPTIVAAHLEHTNTFTPQALAEAERFAMNEYLVALAGPPPAGEAAKALYSRIASMTGVPLDFVTRGRGAVSAPVYMTISRTGGQATSNYDATFKAPDPYPESVRGGGDDPILDGFTRALSGLFVGYARDELGFKTDMTFNLLAHEVSSKWEWGDRREPPGVSGDLRELLSLNPSFRLLVAHGRTDLVTPYGVSRYVLDHLPDIGGRDRVRLKVYRGGHMFYFDAASRREFTADAKAFYQRLPE
jgi:carboxypeptidase C (cathepsin A)